MRLGAEKKLVNAILDAELGIDEIADRASELGATLGERLSAIVKKIITLRAAGQINAGRAKMLFREAYISLTLLGFAKVAQDVIDHGEEASATVAQAAKEFWKENPNASRMDMIRAIEKEQRKKERASGGPS